jgi:hypothetical protein
MSASIETSKLHILGLDPAWASPTGWAVLEYPGDEILGFGTIAALKHSGKVTESVQMQRAAHLSLELRKLLQDARITASAFGAMLHVAYEDPSRWLLAAARERRARRRPVSSKSLLAYGYLRGILWAACADFGIVPVPMESEKARRTVLGGLHVPSQLHGAALKLCGDAVKARAVAGVAVRYGGDDPLAWLENNELTDHEADAIVVAAAAGSRLIQEGGFAL